MSMEDMAARLARLESENKALKQQVLRGVPVPRLPLFLLLQCLRLSRLQLDSER